MHLAYFTKEINLRVAKRLLVFNGRLANRELTSLVKEAAGRYWTCPQIPVAYLKQLLIVIIFITYTECMICIWKS